jgi:hypothetical protein
VGGRAVTIRLLVVGFWLLAERIPGPHVGSRADQLPAREMRLNGNVED